MISNKISAIYPRRSVFNRSSEHKFNCDMGLLIPIEIQQMYPGDKVRLSLQALLRTTPLVVPPMHEINAYCQAYFVAYRALDENFEDFISGGEDGQNSYKLPVLDYENVLRGFGLSRSAAVSKNVIMDKIKYSNWDYLGFPVHPFKTYSGSPSQVGSWLVSMHPNFCEAESDFYVPVISYPFMAISNIWNEYYRDENLEDPIEDDKLADCAFMKPYPVHWNRDYFTNCLPFQQRGISPALPIYGLQGATDFLPLYLKDYDKYLKDVNKPSSATNGVGEPSGVRAEHLLFSTRNSSSLPYDAFANNYTILQYSGGDSKFSAQKWIGDEVPVYGNFTLGNVSDGYLYQYGANVDWSKTNLANLITAGSISELRTAFQIQLWQERNARAGVRYTEFIQAHFGIHPLDERLDRPEYIGGCKFPVITNEVIQTSQSTSDSPQGTLAGRGIGVSDQYIGTYTAKEYGVMIVFFYIKPKSNYSSQGVNRQWQVQSRFDFYSPEFAHLSMQGVKNSELYVDTSFMSSVNNKIFGYTGRFDELRTNYTTVAGDFRPDVGLAPYTDWTLARAFSTTPTLGPEFIQCKPDKRIFAVQNEPGFLCDVGIKQQWLRPMPTIAEPGYIDHSYY